MHICERKKTESNVTSFFFKTILVLFSLFLLGLFVRLGGVLVPRLWRQRTTVYLLSPFVTLSLRSDQVFEHMSLLGPFSLTLWHSIVWESTILLPCGSYRSVKLPSRATSTFSDWATFWSHPTTSGTLMFICLKCPLLTSILWISGFFFFSKVSQLNWG